MISHFLIKKQLDTFGIQEEVIKGTSKKNGVINTSKVNLDEDNPPPEALGFALSNSKPYFTCEAWSSMESMYSSLPLVNKYSIHLHAGLGR